MTLSLDQTAEITAKVNALIAKGNPNSFEKLFAIYAKNAKPIKVEKMNSKDIAKMKSREESNKNFDGITYEGIRYNNIHDYQYAVNSKLKQSI